MKAPRFRGMAAGAMRTAVSGATAAAYAGTAAVTVGTGVVAVGAATGGALLGSAMRAPERAVRAATTVPARGAQLVLGDVHGVGDELVGLLDPRSRRHRRRARTTSGRVELEVRGLTGSAGAGLAGDLDHRLADLPGVTWHHVNAVTGRVTVGVDDPSRRGEVLAAVVAAERAAGTSTATWDREQEHPADAEPVLASALALGGDLVGLVAALAGDAVRLPGPPRGLHAAVALVEAQPRLRRLVEAQLGARRTDLAIAAANALLQATSGGVPNLVVDAGLRLQHLAETRSRRTVWQRWEDTIAGPGGVAVLEPLQLGRRPHPLPPGPIERFADQAASGSLLAAGLSLVGRGSMSEATDAVLVGIPRASRLARESFSATASTRLARVGVLPLDSSVWRRFDRVDTVVVEAAALLGSRPLVLGAQPVDPEWSQAHVWSAAQRLLWEGKDAEALPIPPPRGRDGQRLSLRPDSGRRRELYEDQRLVGRVDVGVELDPSADAVLAAARRAGLRVVLQQQAETAELRSRADELVAPDASLSGVVRRLQADGRTVAVVARHAHRALGCADVGLGLPPTGHLSAVPWSADLVSPDLRTVETLLAGTAVARKASERGRALSLSASVLGGLLLVAGPRRGAQLRAVAPITGAGLLGLLTGTVLGWQAARLPSSTPTPLVPWHALEPDEVLARLDEVGALRSGEARTDVAGLGWHTPLRVIRPLGDRVEAWWSGTARPPLPLRPVVTPVITVAHLGRYVRDELADPLTPVLTVGAAASAVLGSPTDAVLVGAVMGANAVVSAWQRARAERALSGLLLGQRVVARRLPAAPGGGRPDHTLIPPVQVPAERLAVGDVVVLKPGDVVPADARLLAVDGLEVDESSLTGESVTVDKQLAATPAAPPGQRACMVYEGTTVVAGRARAVVVATGAQTTAGRALAAVGSSGTDLGVQAQLRALTDKVLPLTLGGGAAVSLLGLLRAQPLTAAVADGVAVAVAAVPEGLPLVATVSQLAAARRLSRQGVLVRSSRTVEALGRVDTVCFDKTGTLTEGRLRLVGLADLHRRWEPGDSDGEPDARRLLRAAARACPGSEDGEVVHATDAALLTAAQERLGHRPPHAWDPMEELPFDSNRGYAVTVGRTRRKVRLFVKGAPEVLLGRCTRALSGEEPRPLTSKDRERAADVVHALAAEGLRVLLVARRELPTAPDDVEAAVDELTLLGFVALADTPRPSARPVVDQLLASRLDLRLITGDHPVTARAVARQLGMPVTTVVTGPELAELNETARRETVLASTVFARVTPEQKVLIVEALQQAGRVVAMTGDGTNDAAAIRRADVGIGMTAHGSVAARHAADLVLTRPDLSLLLDALVEGRLMWQRVRDAVAVLVGGNAGEVVFTLIGTALSGRAPVGPRQFLLVNLLTDMFPAMAVALARNSASDSALAAPEDIAERAAHAAGVLAAVPPPELGADLLHAIVTRGALTAGTASAAWLLGRASGPRSRAATMGLVALVGSQLGQTLVAGRRSPLVWLTVAGSGAVLVAIVQTPGLSQFFGCVPLDPLAWSTVVISAATATLLRAAVPRVQSYGARVLAEARAEVAARQAVRARVLAGEPPLVALPAAP